MTSTASDLRRISVHFGPNVVDLAVPGGTRVADLVTSGGFPAGVQLVDVGGAAVPADARIADVLHDGDLVVVVGPAPAAPGSAASPLPAFPLRAAPLPAAPLAATVPPGAPLALDAAGAGARPTAVGYPPVPRPAPDPGGRGSHRAARERRPCAGAPATTAPGPPPATLAPGGFAVPVVATVVAVVLLATSAAAVPAWAGASAGAVLLVAALAGAVGGAPGTGLARRWSGPTSALTAGGGGFCLATALPVGLGVAALAGCVLTTAVAMLGRASGLRHGRSDPWVTVTAVAGAAAGGVVAVAVALSWPFVVAPLLLAGAGPLVLRALPSVSLDVPESQLIDTERLSNTSWSARTGVRRRHRPVRAAAVAQLAERATGVVQAGTVAVTAAVAVGYLAAVLVPVPGAAGQAVPRWATLALGLLLAAGLGLAGRTVRDRLAKRVMRAGAALVLVGSAVVLHRQVGPPVFAAAVLGAVVLAAVAVAAAAALDTGWRSLAVSRLADLTESLCVVTALPVALVAAGTLDVLRQAVS